MKQMRVPGILFVVVVALYFLSIGAQLNQTFPQKQYYASDYGVWSIKGQQPNVLLFSPPEVCTIPTPTIGNFIPFNTNAPLMVVDPNASLTEVVTPTSVIKTASYCGVTATLAHSHQSFQLVSGTGGLQEVLNQIPATVPYPVPVILDRNWYSLVQNIPGSTAASIIAEVHGSAAANLVDNTTAPSTTYAWNGSVYVPGQAPSGTVSYTQGATGSVARNSTNKWQDSISINDFGATGHNATNDTNALRNAVAAAAATGKTVFLPANDYYIQNLNQAGLSGANNVLIWGEGPASILDCQTVGGNDCIASTGATGFGLANLTVQFGPTATQRTSGYAVDLETCSNCSLENVTLNNGDLSGLRIASSQHTWLKNLQISNFYANGAFLINNSDLRVDGLSCSNNQDACFETSWFDSEYTAHSVPCENITASNITSNNDLETILVNACRNVAVTNFSSIGAGKEAVFIGQDPSTTTAHWPDRVSIANGSIYGTGYGTNALNQAAAPAIYYNVGTSPGSFVSHSTLTNITANHIASWGLQMAELQNNDVHLSNSQFYDIGNAANSGGTGVYSGCLQTEGNSISLDNVKCTNVGTYGLYGQNSKRLTGTGLNFEAINQQASGVNAVYLATTETGFVNLTNVGIIDTNATSFTGQVYDASTSGSHSMWNIVITYATATGYLGPTAANSATTYTYTDPGHSMVFRNGGMIQSFVPPNYYFLPTAGATPTTYVNGAVLYYQSKCWSSGAQQTESVGWLDQYPDLSHESFSFNQFGGCGFPITINLTAATSVVEPQTMVTTGAMQAQHIGGIASGTYASVPTFTAGTGAGTSPTVSANTNSNDVSGYISVTTGTSPAASAVVVTGTFGTAYATLAKCAIWPANSATAALSGTSAVWAPVASTSAFTINEGSAGLTGATLYIWGYSCTQ